MPLLIFSGFVFGKWWGIAITLTSTTIGATLLYLFAGYFFKEEWGIDLSITKNIGARLI